MAKHKGQRQGESNTATETEPEANRLAPSTRASPGLTGCAKQARIPLLTRCCVCPLSQGLSMAEKLKLWKAQKAKQEGAQAATASATTAAAAASKPPAAPKTAATAAAAAVPPAATASRKPLSGVTASTNNKRAWDSVTTVSASASASAAGPKSTTLAGSKHPATSSKLASHTAGSAGAANAAIPKRAKIVHKPSAAKSVSSDSAASSVQVTPAASVQTTPAASVHTSPVQQQQMVEAISAAEEDAPMASSMDTAQADVAAALASPATPPAPVRPAASSAAAAAAFTTPASLPTISFMTPAAVAAASHASHAAASESLTARLQAWKATRGVQLSASVTKAKARVMDEKRRQAAEVKSSLSQMQPAAFSVGTKARQGTPSLKLSGLATLGLDSAFSRMQSLMRRGAWADAERTVMQLLAVPQTAAEVEARAEVWVCRAYIAEQLGHMDQVLALYDAARQIHPASTSAGTADDGAFHQIIHRGLQSFMCRLAGVDAATEGERQPKVLDQFVAQTMAVAEENSNEPDADAEAEAAASAAAAAAAQEARDEAAMDAILSAGNDSFASVDGTLSTPSHAAQRRLATPVSSNLRAALMGDSSSSNFPLGSPAGRILRPSAAAAAAASFTPRSEALRLELSMQKTPPLSASAKQLGASSRTMTPVSSLLHAELRQDKTPPDAAGSMASLRNSALRITSAPRPSAVKTSCGSAARLHAATSLAEATLSPSLSAPNSAEEPSPSLSDAGVSPALAGASSNRRESLPLLTGVVRNLLGEMDEDHRPSDELNTSSVSCASLGASPAKDADASASASAASASASAASVLEFLDESMEAPESAEPESKEEREALDSERMDLFDQHEYIPGLSTPAAHCHLAYASSSSAAASPMRLPSASPSKRTLTPSKAAQTLSHVLELEQQGSSKVVLASLRAHPRDAARMGSATFLSPVRRSSRRSLAAGPLPSDLSSMDQAGLTKLLEANNFAYHPNPALGRALTPIPRERTKATSSSSAANTPAMERIAEAMVDDEAVSSSSSFAAASVASSRVSLRQATPVSASRTAPAIVGASVVVLQPVRSRHSRRSSGAGTGAVDPKSAEYLLSPVRRSSRHTAPQSLSELTHLLAHTQYAYAPNPLLEEEVKLMQQQQSDSALALAAIHEDLSEEDEEDEEEEEKKAEPVEQQRPDASRMLTPAELDVEADAAAESFEAELHKQIAEEAEARSAAAAFEKEEQTQDCMMNSSSSSSSVSAATRVATPMPLGKKTQSHMLVESSNSKSSWEPSFSSNSGASSSSSVDATLQEVAAKEAKYARMQRQQQDSFAFGPSSIPPSSTAAPRVHEKDADGFFVPLVPARYGSKGERAGKRKQHGSMDDLEEQLSAVCVATAAAAAQARAQAHAHAAKRIATPRPNSKKQRITTSMAQSVAASSMMERNSEEDEEQHELPQPSVAKRHIATPIAGARRSARVATPMH